MDTHGEYTHLCAHLRNPEETGYPALPLCALPLETAITQPGAGLVAQAPRDPRVSSPTAQGLQAHKPHAVPYTVLRSQLSPDAYTASVLTQPLHSAL